MDNSITCNCMETVSGLGIEYQFDYNYEKRNLKIKIQAEWWDKMFKSTLN